MIWDKEVDGTWYPRELTSGYECGGLLQTKEVKKCLILLIVECFKNITSVNNHMETINGET